MKAYYGENVYLLIDEYDTPFISANAGGYYDEVRGILSLLLSSALKGNQALEKAMLTGIERVAKENLFSGLNNIAVCTVKDLEYDRYFGFTEEECEGLLRHYGLELTDEVKQMYDGYLFGNREVYNPWSITFYASRGELEPYWVNTSEYSIIEEAMDICEDNFYENYRKLLINGTVSVDVESEYSFYEQKEAPALWGMLINVGMVTIQEKIESNYYSLRIPNREVSQAFQKLTAHSLRVRHSVMLTMIQSLKRGEMKEFAEEYQKILLELPSYYDLQDENSYHMMMLGMCAYLYGDYDVKSNRENGKGRSDVLLCAKKKKYPHMILEFKYTKDKSQNLQELAQSAVEQIKEKKYDVGMQGRIYYIGIAHYGKNAEVRWAVEVE